MRCDYSVRRTVAVHSRRSGGRDVDNRPIAIIRCDHVIRGVATGAIADDQIAAEVNIDTAIIACDSIPINTVIAGRCMNPGPIAARSTVVITCVVNYQALARYPYTISLVFDRVVQSRTVLPSSTIIPSSSLLAAEHSDTMQPLPPEIPLAPLS